MAHIDIPEGLPGIRGLMAYRPDTALPINQLVEVLLQGPVGDDTVLIAAVFCMAKRYVDGLATWGPDDPELYARAGAFRALNGYLAPPPPLR